MEPSFPCSFCKKVYKREDSFLVHMCAGKQRFLDMDLPHVKLGFAIYTRWWQLAFGTKRASQRTFTQFAESQYYTAFTKFGRYIRSINAINPMAFVEYLVRGEVKLDRWESPVVYESYVRDLNKRESPDAAVERNILLMHDWQVAQGGSTNWYDFFRQIAPAQATLWIRSGRISPWVLYTAPSASALFDRLSDEQMTLIESTIDPQFWRLKLEEHASEVATIRRFLSDEGC